MPEFAFGQEAEAAGGESELKAPTLLELIKEGGWAMIPLFTMSVALVSLIVYNAIQLTKAKFCPPELKMAVMEHMQNCRVRSSIEIASTSPTYLGRLLTHALPKVDATQPETLGRADVEEAMIDFTVNENRGHMNWISYLSIIAQAAPMVGLLGTVSGMIGAFNVLRVSKAADPSQLAGNISEALVTTASGLVVALPCVFAYFFFKTKFTGLVADAQNTTLELVDASVATANAGQELAKVPEGLQG